MNSQQLTNVQTHLLDQKLSTRLHFYTTNKYFYKNFKAIMIFQAFNVHFSSIHIFMVP
jgi:hypothetical protein